MDIVYSSEALNDLISIYSYISVVLLEPNIAENQVMRIKAEIRKLDQMPLKHKLVNWDPWHTMGMRFFPVDNYEIYYLVNQNDSKVQIVRIFYSGRDVENIIGDKYSDHI